ncbi:hypothetical protein LX36DRAFT_17359 [Colletotrichum falcatum]|nr:hypothetical protein LX36DRAFT_17359 [Colletotrichum falcatum]
MHACMHSLHGRAGERTTASAARSAVSRPRPVWIFGSLGPSLTCQRPANPTLPKDPGRQTKPTVSSVQPRPFYFYFILFYSFCLGPRQTLTT